MKKAENKVIATKTITTMKLKVHTIQFDIDDGECRIATKCMERVAVARALTLAFPKVSPHTFRVRVDAGTIKFNVDGYRWEAKTPNVAKKALIRFDMNLPVEPHSYTLTAVRKSKIVKLTLERQLQINAAREQRIAEGRPDKSYRNSIRKRIVGFDAGRI